MTLHEAQKICTEINAEITQGAVFGTVKFEYVYSSVEEMLNDLAKVFIPKNRIAPPFTFKGYDFIYSFAYYLSKGWKLSESQIRQCKRLALEIKKAAAISEYKF